MAAFLTFAIFDDARKGHLGNSDELAGVAMIGSFTVIALIAGIVRGIGSFKLLRRRRAAWGWGLAAAIVGCMDFAAMFPCCVAYGVTLAVGIYTIVILCQPMVRGYLRDVPEGPVVIPTVPQP
jgi:hypothetical protein